VNHAPALDSREFLRVRAALFDAVKKGDDVKAPLWEVYRREAIARREMLLAEAEANTPAAARLRAQLRHRSMPIARDLPSMAEACLFWLRTFAVIIEPRDAGEGDNEGDAP
jgi:hypothetical protein